MVKNLPANAGGMNLIPGLGRSPEKEWLPTQVFLPEEFHGQRSLEGYNPWSRIESDMTERLTLSLSLQAQWHKGKSFCNFSTLHM